MGLEQRWTLDLREFFGVLQWGGRDRSKKAYGKEAIERLGKLETSGFKWMIKLTLGTWSLTCLFLMAPTENEVWWEFGLFPGIMGVQLYVHVCQKDWWELLVSKGSILELGSLEKGPRRLCITGMYILIFMSRN